MLGQQFKYFYLISILSITLILNVTSASNKFCDNLSDLPVLHDGRIKPLISLADSCLLNLCGERRVEELNSIEWLLELFFFKQKAYDRSIFFVKHDDVLLNIGVQPRRNKRYSLNDLVSPVVNNLNLIKVIENIDHDQRTLSQRELLNLYLKVSLILRLDMLTEPIFIDRDHIVANELFIINNDFKTFLQKTGDIYLLPIGLNSWVNLKDCYENNYAIPHNLLRNVSIAYFAKNDAWKKACSEIKVYSYSFLNLSFKSKINIEVYYVKFLPIIKSAMFYFLSFILSCVCFFRIFSTYIFRLSLLFFILGFVIHLLSVFARVFITGRAPVTTLLESILFVNLLFAFIIIILMFKNYKYKNLIFLYGCLTVSVLQYTVYMYELDGDSIRVLLPVLNTNFWLTMHVITISIGYSFCLISSVIAHVFLYNYVKSFEKDNFTQGVIIVNTVCILALFFSSLGTMLGGIWADQSWGRFWGWDPKENGALLIVLWLTFILHFRSTPFFSPFFYFVFTVLNGMVVFIAWFGVNLLNAGLHSYGFVQNIGRNMFVYCLLEFIFIFILAFVYYVNKKRLRLKHVS